MEEELGGKLGIPLIITWDWDAIQKGQNWSTTDKALRIWISKNTRNLSDGNHRITDAPGVPFAFDIRKGGPIKIDGVRFSRHAPKDSTFGKRLRDQLAGRHKKLAALGAHQAEGRTTVLLLESRDLAPMSPVMIVNALDAAFPTCPAEVDEVRFMHYVAPGTERAQPALGRNLAVRLSRRQDHASQS